MENIYFTTSTINGHLPLLKRHVIRTIIVDSLKHLIEKNRISLHGYVIMPTHLHTVFSVCKGDGLSTVFRDFHKFTAHKILRNLKDLNDPNLAYLKSKKQDRAYQVWKTYHAPRPVESDKVLWQKLEYIHHNPCRKGWHLCENPEDYPYSSAAEYYREESGLLKIEKIDLL